MNATLEASYVCDICGKQFSKIQYLNQHLNIHSGKKTYSCSVCCKTFLYQQSYKEHLQRHSGNKTVQCEQCGKRFYNKRELEGHKKKHSQKGRFHCEECGIFFSKENSLQAHCNRLHIPCYTCTFCRESLSDKKLLRKHEFRQHKKGKKSKVDSVKRMKMVCPLCGKVLCNKWRLESHLVSKHKMEKGAIIEKGFLHFQRRNTNRPSEKEVSTSVGKKSNMENEKYSGDRDSHALGLGRRNTVKEKNVISASEVTVPALNTGFTNAAQNIYIDDCFGRPNSSVSTSENINSVCTGILYKESKSQGGDTGMKKVDDTMDITETEEENIGVKYNVTISNISVDSADKDSGVILKNVCYDPCRKQFTLQNVLDKSNETMNSEMLNSKTIDGNTVDTSTDEYKVLENSQELGVHATCVFSNDDIDSESTCTVDLSESGSLVEDVTDSYEVLQHEFDEIPDTAENDIVQQEDTSLVLRPSSAALQEYFARYNDMLERKQIATSRLKAAALVSEETFGTYTSRSVDKVGSTCAFRYGVYPHSTGKLGLYGKDHHNDISKDSSQTKLMSGPADVSKAVENDDVPRAAKTISDNSDSKSEMCFKRPEGPWRTLPKKRLPRLYSVTSKCMDSQPMKYSQESVRIMTMSEIEEKGKCFVNYTEKTEIPPGNVMNSIPDDFQMKCDRDKAVSDSVKWDAQSKGLRTRKIPLIFRISNCTGSSQNSLYTQPSNIGPGSVATTVSKPGGCEKFSLMDKAVSDGARKELKSSQGKWS